jgi:hypothetical protein
MVVPFIALIVILVGLVLFFTLAGKKKNDGRDLGDRRAGNPVSTNSQYHGGV